MVYQTPEMSVMADYARATDPKFKIAYKDQSAFMKFLGFFAQIFNKNFMTTYTTVIGSTVYFPSEAYVRENELRAAHVLAHEIIHMIDTKRNGRVATFLGYAFPQILAVLAVLSVFGDWWLLNLLWLLCLAPLPAPWRRDAEMRGYRMSIAMDHWLGYDIKDPARVSTYVAYFVGPSYWFMWPFRDDAVKRVEAAITDVLTGRIYEETPFKLIHDALIVLGRAQN